MDLDGWSLIWFVVPGIIVPAALLVLAFRSPSWKQMTRWATQAQVTITTENEDMIRRRLARARRYRSLVSFPFWWVLAVPVITGPLPEWANDVIWIPLTGYVLGSILAAVSNTEKTGALRVADLSPRLPSSYVPRRERLAPWLVLGVTAAALVSIKAFPPRFPQSLRTQIPLFVTAVVVAVLAEVALRMVAARPQVTDSPTRRLADNALRSTGATAAVASSIMLSLFTLNSAISALLGSGHRAWIGVPLMLLVTGMTYGAFWVIVTQQPWAPGRRRSLRAEPVSGPDPAAESVSA